MSGKTQSQSRRQLEIMTSVAADAMWHSGRKSQRKQSAILLASILSFFFFASAIAAVSDNRTSTYKRTTAVA
jgi:hypothetical protein